MNGLSSRARRAAEISAVAAVVRLRRRVECLEVAAAENAELDAGLAAEVARLEHTVADLARRAVAARARE